MAGESASGARSVIGMERRIGVKIYLRVRVKLGRSELANFAASQPYIYL